MAIDSRFVVASIEARMTSTRLPGKVLLPCIGRTMLELMVERVRRSRHLDAIVIATTVNKTDEPIVELAQKLDLGLFRGSELDVAGRVTAAMQAAKADVVVRLTSDCPLIDPEVIDQIVRIYLANDFDYVTNAVVRTYPDGLDVQVASLQILERCYQLCENDKDREHVFYSARRHADKIKMFHVVAPPELCWPQWRWTLDTQKDYQRICRIYENLYQRDPAFTSRAIAQLMHAEPDLAD